MEYIAGFVMGFFVSGIFHIWFLGQIQKKVEEYVDRQLKGAKKEE